MSPTSPALPRLTASAAEAAAAFRSGGLVAFPTETVYGLGADADDEEAVRRVFAVKGRPGEHPLIVHLPDMSEMTRWAVGVPAWASALAEALWPGPLTLVVPRADRVLDAVTGGQGTVGLRVPAHRLTLEWLALADVGVAGPSANRFGGVSPTLPAHVLDDLGDRLDPVRDLVLDGGPCGVGLESTIVLAVDTTPRLLRPGAVSARVIEEISGRRLEDGGPTGVRAPGTLESHYSPAASVVMLTAEQAAAFDANGQRLGIIAPADVDVPPGLEELARPRTVEEYAHELYAALRGADARRLQVVVAVPPPGEDGLAIAIRDRLRRASAGR